MGKLGYVSIIVGLLTIVGYVFYQMASEVSMPFIMNLALVLIVFGVVIVLIKQLFDRQNEKKEEEEFKDL